MRENLVHTLLLALIASIPTLLLAQEPINSFSFLGDGRTYQSQNTEARAVAVEIERTMDRLMGQLVELSPEGGSDPGIRVQFAQDEATGTSLQEFEFRSTRSESSSHVVLVDRERWTYRMFTLNPTDLQGDIRRLSEYVAEKGDAGFIDETFLRANLLNLHGRHLSAVARNELPSLQVRGARRDFCVMSALIEIDTWEPARLPVAITELATIAVGYPSMLSVRRHGRCWFAPSVDVNWDGGLWSTTWHLVDCIDGSGWQGSTFISDVFSRGYNEDFYMNQYFNVDRVWVAHRAKIYTDDATGRVWYQGWAGEWGRYSSDMLASGINIANSYTTTNCNL